MPKVILYIAMSLDGFIAREDGDVSWLDAYHADGEDYGYAEFYTNIGAVIMGSVTFEQTLAFGPWEHSGKKTYVLSSREFRDRLPPNVIVSSDDPSTIVGGIERQTAQNIWLVGGSKVIASFMNKRLIDEFMIFVTPIILGAGIPLFKGISNETQLGSAKTQAYATGIVKLHYERPK